MSLISDFQSASKNNNSVILEGFHALKHAIRFKGKISQIVTADLDLLNDLITKLAPDVKERVLKNTIVVSDQDFAKLSPRQIRTKVISLAQKPKYKLEDLDASSPLVLLDNPKDLGNIGAVIRVAAAAGAGAVLMTGEVDPWHPNCVRGSAGLHFALPVFSVDIKQILQLGKPLIGLDERGDDRLKDSDQNGSIYVFGSERDGISPEIRNNLSDQLRIPMRPGVSSLNLATAVAITLYSHVDIGF